MKTLVVGIGSLIRGDDAVGVHIARELRKCDLPGGVEVTEIGTAGLGLLDLVAGYDRLILLDAIQCGALPGSIRVLRGDEITRTARFGVGHHSNLATTLAVHRWLQEAGTSIEVTVVAVEVSDATSFSEHLTDAVKAAVPVAVRVVREILASRKHGRAAIPPRYRTATHGGSN